MRTARLATAALILLAPGVLLLPVWRLGGLGAGEDDVMFYLPARVFFHDSIAAGHAPWLNPWTGLGRPGAADPQTALGYPPTWLFAVLPPLVAYAAVLWLHYSLALWGAYRLLRAMPLDRCAAVFGGLAFAFSGFMLAHRAHFTLACAAAWTPWIFWRLRVYAFCTADDPRRVQRLIGVVVPLALQCFAGHVQAAALTALGTLVYLVALGGFTRAIVLRWLTAGICTAGLFAVQWLPTLEYTRICTRVERTYLHFVENSWYPLSAVGLVLPMFFGQRTPNTFNQPWWGPSHQVEQFAYAGVLVLILALLGLRTGWRVDPRRRGWVGLLIFALLLALGLFGPICPLLYLVPGSNNFRCPARALLLGHLSLAMLAAVTLHDLGPRLSPQLARLRYATLGLTRRPVVRGLLIIAVPLLLTALALPLLPAETRPAALTALRPWNPAVWAPLLLWIVGVALLHEVARRWREAHWRWACVAFTALDLGVIGWTLDVPAGWPAAQDLYTPRDAAWLDDVRDSGDRLWVITPRPGFKPGEYFDPVDKLVANTNVLQRVPSLTDYGPLQPRAYVDPLAFEPWGEALDPQRLLRDPRWLRLLDVGWLLLCDPQLAPPATATLVHTTAQGWRLYRNPLVRGTAFFADAAQPGTVRLTRRAPHHLTTYIDPWPGTTEHPLVVVSHLALPGWTATHNGRPLKIEPVQQLVLATRVPGHEALAIDWNYFPPGLRTGAAITLLTALVLAGGLLGERTRRPRTPHPG